MDSFLSLEAPRYLRIPHILITVERRGEGHHGVFVDTVILKSQEGKLFERFPPSVMKGMRIRTYSCIRKLGRLKKKEKKKELFRIVSKSS